MKHYFSLDAMSGIRVIDIVNASTDVKTFIREYFSIPSKMGEELKESLWNTRPVDVRITIDYPLNEPYSKVFAIYSQGDVLLRAADMYKEVYEMDAQEGGGGRMCDDPSSGSCMLNKGFGPKVWGHVMEDLMFETINVKKVSNPNYTYSVTFSVGS